MTIKFFNNPEKLWKLVSLMLDGAGVTLSIFFLTLLFSLPLGMIVALLLISFVPQISLLLPQLTGSL